MISMKMSPPGDGLKQLSIADLDLPPKRGRPKTGNALSNADKQKAYRLRQKQKPRKLSTDRSEVQRVATELEQLYLGEITKLHADIAHLRHALEEASSGWPEVQDRMCKFSLEAKVWRLKYQQAIRIIREARLPLPDNHDSHPDYMTSDDQP